MPPQTQPHDPFGLVGHLLDGRYRVDHVVAEGGFGLVYKAHHLSLDRPVALKALKIDEGPGRLPEFRQHFAAEAQTMARLKHPNIADVYDSGIVALGGREVPWIALEWLEGETLEARMEARRGQGGMSPAETLALLRPALAALGYAHRKGIAHRDIKPGNLMVTEDAAGVHVRVLDFGISKIMSPDEEAGSGRTRTGGAFMFSPGYASPEQISAGRTGPWTDVHALGLVLTEMLTDQLAIAGSEIVLYSQVLSETRPTPRSKGVNVGAWEAVLQKALALQPNARWKDASALLEALEGSVAQAEASVQGARTAGFERTVSASDHPPLSLARPAAALRAVTADSPVTTLTGISSDGRPAVSPKRATIVGLCLAAVAAGGTALLFVTRDKPVESMATPAAASVHAPASENQRAAIVAPARAPTPQPSAAAPVPPAEQPAPAPRPRPSAGPKRTVKATQRPPRPSDPRGKTSGHPSQDPSDLPIR